MEAIQLLPVNDGHEAEDEVQDDVQHEVNAIQDDGQEVEDDGQEVQADGEEVQADEQEVKVNGEEVEDNEEGDQDDVSQEVQYEMPNIPEPEPVCYRRRGKYVKLIFIMAIAFTIIATITVIFWDNIWDYFIEEEEDVFLDYEGKIRLTKHSVLKNRDKVYFNMGGQMVGLPYADYILYKNVPGKNICHRYRDIMDL